MIPNTIAKAGCLCLCTEAANIKKMSGLKAPVSPLFPLHCKKAFCFCYSDYCLFGEITYSLFLEIINSSHISIFTSNFKKIYRRKETCWTTSLPFTLVANTDWSSNKCLWYWVWCSDKWNSWTWYIFFFFPWIYSWERTSRKFKSVPCHDTCSEYI